MHYWNKANFDGLSKLATEFDIHAMLKPLANYCRLRERGLRGDAFSALDGFLVAAQSFDTETARFVAVRILECATGAHGVHQILTQPLITRFLFPTLKAWMDAEPNTNVPVRWLGILSRDTALLAKALSMCPGDVAVRTLLIAEKLSIAEFATHHLDETVFLGKVEDAIVALGEAKALIDTAPDSNPFGWLESELHHLSAQIADWLAYSDAPEGSFPEWCRARGRKYTYPIKVYYSR